MSGSPEVPALEGRDLACVRGERLIFKGLGFTLPAGGALLLTGRNGSGKSSLLRMLAGLLPPARGHLHQDGDDIADDLAGYRASLHYQGHLDAVKPALSATENLAAATTVLGGDTGAATEALARCGLTAVADFPGRLLSQGQKRRLALARLITTERPLWLMDEPTAALDTEGRGLVEALIAGHRAAGGAVVVSTHVELDVPGADGLNLDAFPGGRIDPLFGLDAGLGDIVLGEAS
ncbi:MAG: heme ABC exporter ATP-binding protein CcmA [Alphaproteobacteria bacterium]|nr:heme ABC exporter ATP-binding protein CcmA [Alphaproteobacteria bacterium]